MKVFIDALVAIFADPHLAEDALWRAGGTGPAIAVRIVRRSPDRIERFGDSRALLGSLAVDVRQSEAPSLTEGDTVEIAGTNFRVAADPVSDGLGLAFTIELVPT